MQAALSRQFRLLEVAPIFLLHYLVVEAVGGPIGLLGVGCSLDALRLAGFLMLPVLQHRFESVFLLSDSHTRRYGLVQPVEGIANSLDFVPGAFNESLFEPDFVRKLPIVSVKVQVEILEVENHLLKRPFRLLDLIVQAYVLAQSVPHFDILNYQSNQLQQFVLPLFLVGSQLFTFHLHNRLQLLLKSLSLLVQTA